MVMGPTTAALAVYMVTDPPTTPSTPRSQTMFGASVAAVYGLLMVSHVVFGLFFALTIVSTVRGLYLVSRSWTMAWQTPESLAAGERLGTPPPPQRGGLET